jgi:hypothetical protein
LGFLIARGNGSLFCGPKRKKLEITSASRLIISLWKNFLRLSSSIWIFNEKEKNSRAASQPH